MAAGLSATASFTAEARLPPRPQLRELSAAPHPHAPFLRAEYTLFEVRHSNSRSVRPLAPASRIAVHVRCIQVYHRTNIQK